MDALVFGFEWDAERVESMTLDQMAFWLKRGNAYRKRQREALGK